MAAFRLVEAHWRHWRASTCTSRQGKFEMGASTAGQCTVVQALCKSCLTQQSESPQSGWRLKGACARSTAGWLHIQVVKLARAAQPARQPQLASYWPELSAAWEWVHSCMGIPLSSYCRQGLGAFKASPSQANRITAALFWPLQGRTVALVEGWTDALVGKL